MAEKTSVRHYDCGTGDALYRAILDEPVDVLRRLVFADWLEEQGQLERAEFVRIQCEGCDGRVTRLWQILGGQTDWFADLLKLGGNAASDWGVCPDGAVHYEGKYRRGEFWVRNGFVDEVRCPLGWWVGGECDCRAIRTDPATVCRTCHGTGKTLGHGAEVVARHPVTKVVATDLEPSYWRGAEWRWHDLDYWVGLNSVLRPPVYAAVRRVGGVEREPSAIGFPTRQAAVEALSDALVDLAREAAGLRQLVRKVEVTS